METKLQAIRQRLKEKEDQEKQALCGPAQALYARFLQECGELFVTGGTPEAITQARTLLEHLQEEFSPEVATPHFASLWSTHRCVSNIYQETMQRLNAIAPPRQPPQEVILGTDTTTNAPVRVPQIERMRGMYILGMNGTGKSTLLLEMLTQDIQAGNGICLLDPHADLTNAVLDRVPPHRADDVIILDLESSTHAWGLNIFTCPDPTSPREVTRTVDQVLQAFSKIWGTDMAGTPGLADMLRMITVTLVSNPGTTMADIQRLLTDDTFREKLVANVQDRIVREFWELEYNPLKDSGKQQLRASILRRIRALLTPLLYNIVSQPQSAVDFRSVMDTGKILLVQLDAELADVTSLLGTIIVGQFLQAALSRKDVGHQERRPFFLYADEYHRFATPFFGTLIQEARKYNIGTIMAHQARYQLKVLGEETRRAPLGAPNLIVFQVTAEDARELVGRFTQTDQELLTMSHADWQQRMHRQLVNMPRFIAQVKTGTREYTIRIPYHPVAPQLEKQQRLRQESRKRYYREIAPLQQVAPPAVQPAPALPVDEVPDKPQERDVTDGGDDAPMLRTRDQL